MAHVISVINQKGGVGKTTTAAALGAGLRDEACRVLMVDLDSQCNLSYSMGASAGGRSVYDVLTGKAGADGIVCHTDNGDLLAGSANMAVLENAIGAHQRKPTLIRDSLGGLFGLYDYVIIDTPPSLGFVTVNALTASNEVIIPAKASAYSLQGIGGLYQTIKAVRDTSNPSLVVVGILITMYQGRAILSRDMSELLEQTAEQFGTKVFASRIRQGVAIEEAQAARRNIFDYAPKSNASNDYNAFITEYLKDAVIREMFSE